MSDTYEVPEKFVSATIHFLYGLSERETRSLVGYMREKKFALTADLMASGFSPTQIEEAVNSGLLKAVPWPRNQRKTDFYWLNDRSAEQELQRLADEAVKYCSGEDPTNPQGSDPIGGDFASVGAKIGSQQLALPGLIYAREQGRLVEFEELDRGAGPIYMSSQSPLARIF